MSAFVSENVAVAPATVAVTLYGPPAVALAVKADEVACPLDDVVVPQVVVGG
jgi:hypothetical protein